MAAIDPEWEPSLAFAQSMGDVEVPPPRATPADAFDLALERYLEGQKLDMVALATELGVARATLYRWTGDRDRLLADLITAQFVRGSVATDQAAKGQGVERLTEIIGGFIHDTARDDALRAFLVNEGESGLRLLTSPTGPIRPRIVQSVAAVIRREEDAGAYRPPVDPDLLADGIVSLGERYLHNGGDPSLNPDPETAVVIVALLLRENA